MAAASPPAHAVDNVAFDQATAGTIVVLTKERQLYLVLAGGRALRYSVGVGKLARQWTGTASIADMYVLPNWIPPAAVRHDNPNLPAMVAGGAANNPLGAAAMTLSGGDYAIHGTNTPASIGGFVSYGCIRMTNADIIDLYARVMPGTPVIVVN
ncbi:L,D-transpeptidase [Devosia sp. YR412]|uniref:L,D-transpeptidase n=1 Tax=Devosia sp. YR412 TaxID=1881030 RepID=UPI001FCDF339|nr:L,D-transpeptidase [Devosia sp. YR412]